MEGPEKRDFCGMGCQETGAQGCGVRGLDHVSMMARRRYFGLQLWQFLMGCAYGGRPTWAGKVSQLRKERDS